MHKHWKFSKGTDSCSYDHKLRKCDHISPVSPPDHRFSTRVSWYVNVFLKTFVIVYGLAPTHLTSLNPSLYTLSLFLFQNTGSLAEFKGKLKRSSLLSSDNLTLNLNIELIKAWMNHFQPKYCEFVFVPPTTRQLINKRFSSVSVYDASLYFLSFSQSSHPSFFILWLLFAGPSTTWECLHLLTIVFILSALVIVCSAHVMAISSSTETLWDSPWGFFFFFFFLSFSLKWKV